MLGGATQPPGRSTSSSLSRRDAGPGAAAPGALRLLALPAPADGDVLLTCSRLRPRRARGTRQGRRALGPPVSPRPRILRAEAPPPCFRRPEGRPQAPMAQFMQSWRAPQARSQHVRLAAAGAPGPPPPGITPQSRSGSQKPSLWEEGRGAQGLELQDPVPRLPLQALEHFSVICLLQA